MRTTLWNEDKERFSSVLSCSFIHTLSRPFSLPFFLRISVYQRVQSSCLQRAPASLNSLLRPSVSPPERLRLRSSCRFFAGKRDCDQIRPRFIPPGSRAVSSQVVLPPANGEDCFCRFARYIRRRTARNRERTNRPVGLSSREKS